MVAMLQPNAARDAAARIHAALKEHVEYWSAKEAMKENILRAQLPRGALKPALQRALRESGAARQLLDLAFAMRERLLLPLDKENGDGAQCVPSDVWAAAARRPLPLRSFRPHATACSQGPRKGCSRAHHLREMRLGHAQRRRGR